MTKRANGTIEKAGYNPDEPRDDNGPWTTGGFDLSAEPRRHQSDSEQVAQDESEEAKVGRNLPFVARAEATAAAGDPAAAATELQRILQQNPADYANARAAFLQSALPDVTRDKVTIGIGVVEDTQGARKVVFSSSEASGAGLSFVRPSLQPLLQPNEIVVPSDGHAEINILEYSKSNDLRVIAVGAGRPYCAACAKALDDAGVLATGPRK
jgi:hypothetical protein